MTVGSQSIENYLDLTALAAATAERAGLQLAGFARDGSLEIYVDS